MRKLMILVVGLVGGLAIVAWSAAPAASGPAKASTRTVSNFSVARNYSVLFTFRDAQHQQDGNGAGTLTFDGAGHLGGTISEQSRCLDTSPTTPCGSATNIRMQVVSPSNYSIGPDSYASLDICVHITYDVGPQGGTPGNANQYVEFMWEGAFSTFFFHGRFIQTLLKPIPATATGCDSSTPWVQTPNVTTADLERV